MTAYLPNGAEQSTVLLAQDIHTDSKFNPYAAVVVHPNVRSTVTATVHFSWNNNTDGENDLRFWNYQYPNPGQTYVKQTYTFTQGSEPLRVALGGSLQGRLRDDGRAPWEIGVQLLGERWSKYHNRQGVIPGPYKDVNGKTIRDDPWNNTLSYAIGGGFLWRDRHVTADLAYVPSPVPDQNGRTNYVDNSRLLASLGIEGPVRFLGRDLEAGITLFGAYFLPREVTKDPNATNPVWDEYPDTATDIKTGLPAADAAGFQTNNPGYPGWKSTGYMLGAGATFRIAR